MLHMLIGAVVLIKKISVLFGILSIAPFENVTTCHGFITAHPEDLRALPS